MTRRAPFALSITVLLISAIVVLPLLVVLSSVFSVDLELWSHLAETVLSDYLINSLALAAVVGFGTIIIGTLLAYLMVNFRFFGKGLLKWLILLPLAMPAYIIAYTYTGLLDFAGPVQSFIRESLSLERGEYWFWDVRSLSGAMVMMILVLYPYVYILARTAFAEQSHSLYRVSQLAGLSRGAHILKVSLPLARPAIITGASLAMMEALADYGTVAYFGVSTFSTGIFRTWFGMGNVQGAAQLASMLCVFVLALLILEKRSRKNAEQYQSRAKQGERQAHLVKVDGIKGVLLFLLCLLPALLGFIIPFAQLAVWSIQYASATDLTEFVELVINSFMLALIGAVSIVALALSVSYAKRLAKASENAQVGKGQGGKKAKTAKALSIAQQALSLGYALPGIVIAVGVLIVAGFADKQLNVFTRWSFDYMPGLVISGSILILLFAYAVRFMSVALQNTETGLERIPQKMDNAALSLHASIKRLLFKIQVPLLSASLISALLLVFVDILKELPATLVLRPFNFNTLAVRAYELASDERLLDAALPAISIVLVALVPVILLTQQLNYQQNQQQKPQPKQQPRNEKGQALKDLSPEQNRESQPHA